MIGSNEIRFNTATMMSILQKFLDSHTVDMMVAQVTNVTWDERDQLFVVSLDEKNPSQSRT